MRLDRPDPCSVRHAIRVDHTDDPQRVAGGLLEGRVGIVTDTWATGISVLSALGTMLPRPPETAPRAVRQAWRGAWEEASQRLLAPLGRGRIRLRGAPAIGFVRELYPEPDIALPMEILRRMHRADGVYRDGAKLAVLGHALHPFWGTYVPSRTDHLELFATWLAAYTGPRGRAIDVGTGSGVLAFMLAKSGFSEVLATDSNPNAVESVRRDVARREPTPPIRTWQGDLMPTDGPLVDLIVFNPPWLFGAVGSPLDAALYTEDAGLLSRWVDRALPRLATDGRLVVVFSNLIELVQPDRPHPVRAELERGRVREVQCMRRKAKGTRLSTGQRRRTKERLEVWELAVSE